MKVKCLKCQIVKELNNEELQEAGEFVEKRKLRAVGFLKVLSMDLREENLCTNGKNHEFEYDPEFDKDIHVLAANVKDAKGIITVSEKEIIECEKIITEMTTKAEIAKKRSAENEIKSQQLLDKIGEIAYIKDETLWT